MGYFLERKDMVFAIAFFFIVGFIFGTALAPEKEVVRYLVSNFSVAGNSVKMTIPAVDQDGNGVAGLLITTIKPGSGLVLVNVNDVIAQFTTQLSGRTAAKAASGFTKIDAGNLDIIYTIKVDASAIEGPSAGAAMAISIIAALQNKTLLDNVSITGTISESGEIGPAGGILEKARAAKKIGVRTFLVPPGQVLESNIVPEKQCSLTDGVEYCKVQYVEKGRTLGELTGLQIIEVSNLQEAVGYFID